MVAALTKESRLALIVSQRKGKQMQSFGGGLEADRDMCDEARAARFFSFTFLSKLRKHFRVLPALFFVYRACSEQ